LRSYHKRASLAALIEGNDVDIVVGCEAHLDLDDYYSSEVFPAHACSSLLS